MKRIIVIFGILLSSSTIFAQNDCSKGDAFFTFDNGERATEIHTLGSNPQFPFLRHLSTPKQVYAAIKRNEHSEYNKDKMDRFNRLMMSIGFTNGIADIQESSITAATIPSGSEGNMGSATMTGGYYKLTGDPSGYKAWKITSGTGCYVYFLSACGNAFYPNANPGRTACVNTPVNVTSQPKEITVGTTPSTILTDKTYVYYHMKKYRNDDELYARAEIADATPSKPLLLNASKRVEANPTTYKISVSGPSEAVTVCADKPTDVAAEIDVEQISSFTGNYPASARQGYKEVSKRAYMRAERKMRKVEKKEAKVEAITGVPVSIE